MPPLGFIPESERTQAQQDAHILAVARMPRFALPIPKLAKGEAVLLTRLWEHADVIADVGFKFERAHQLTGSCVRAGGQNAVQSTIASQRMASDHPTLAFLPYTWHSYALSRHYMGDDGQGEGSFGSTFARSLRDDGIRDWVPGEDTMCGYTTTDGFITSERDEMAWSSYRNPGVAIVRKTSQKHLFGNAAECKSVEDIRAMVLNGYGVTFACDRYIGNGSVRGSGEKARVMGKWDGSGGHQQSVHGFEIHEDFGPIYLVLNSWPRDTYPTLPHQPVCSTWVLEDDVERAFRYQAEVYGLSHLNWFEARPKLLEHFF